MFSIFETQTASNLAPGVDKAFLIIIGISLFFLIGITAVMIYILIRYNRKRHPKAVQIHESTPLEITWTIIPLIVVMVMFYYGFIAFSPMTIAPKDSLVVGVVGKMWVWEFNYPGDKVSDTLMLPINKPVNLEMTSLDVIHSLFIPGFRVKQDLVPGSVQKMWFIPERIGTYEILCAEYCGLRHSFMGAKAVVVTQEEFDKWLAARPKRAQGEPEGLALIKKNACTGCHSLDGTKLVGPSLKGLFGRKFNVLVDGKPQTIVADSSYIVESILNPDAKTVEGFNKGLMKSYKGVIPTEDINKIFQYLKTIDGK
jgi:cytochrome c oxidase subunit II